MGSHLSRLEDLDGLDIRFLAPAAGTPFGQRNASRPFGAAVSRHAFGPELARRVRGEVDHHAMAVEAAHAGALVQLAVLVDSPELNAHAAPLNDCRGVGATPAAPRCMARSGRAGTSEPGGGITEQRAGSNRQRRPANGSCRWLPSPAHEIALRCR